MLRKLNNLGKETDWTQKGSEKEEILENTKSWKYFVIQILLRKVRHSFSNPIGALPWTPANALVARLRLAAVRVCESTWTTHV